MAVGAVIALTESPEVSLIVPLLSETQLAAIDKTSSASVAALAAPIASVNVNALVPDPLAYESVWFEIVSLVTVNCGVPVTVCASLK